MAMQLPHAQDEFITQRLEEAVQPFQLLNSVIVPRPIAFITTQSPGGIINAAPFSYFNVVCAEPARISVAIERRDGGHKDTARNIFSTKEFVINICSVGMAYKVTQASGEYPSDVSEIDITQLTLVPSLIISTPRIAESPIQMECQLKQVFEIEGGVCDLFIGEVLNVHLHKTILNEKGRVDADKLNPLVRLSDSYGRVTEVFEVNI